MKELEISRFREGYEKALEKGPVSTAQLLRWARNILTFNPNFSERAGGAAYLNVPWVSFGYGPVWEHGDYLVRFDKKEIQMFRKILFGKFQRPGPTKTIEALSITKNLLDGRAEEIQIVSEGFDSEQKFDLERSEFVKEENGGEIFRGVSYIIGKNKIGDELKDEKTNEIATIGEYSNPVYGKEALVHALRLLKELL